MQLLLACASGSDGAASSAGRYADAVRDACRSSACSDATHLGPCHREQRAAGPQAAAALHGAALGVQHRLQDEGRTEEPDNALCERVSLAQASCLQSVLRLPWCSSAGVNSASGSRSPRTATTGPACLRAKRRTDLAGRTCRSGLLAADGRHEPRRELNIPCAGCTCVRVLAGPPVISSPVTLQWSPASGRADRRRRCDIRARGGAVPGVRAGGTMASEGQVCQKAQREQLLRQARQPVPHVGTRAQPLSTLASRAMTPQRTARYATHCLSARAAPLRRSARRRARWPAQAPPSEPPRPARCQSPPPPRPP
jgi:hypothetical protein